MDDRKWTELKISLKKSIGENNFNNWLSPVEFSHIEDDVAIFLVPTNFLGNYVSQNFGEIIVAQISSDNDKINRIRFEVDTDLNNFGDTQPSTPAHINVQKDTAERLFKLLNTLEENEDVQNVSSNFEVSEEVLAALTNWERIFNGR